MSLGMAPSRLELVLEQRFAYQADGAMLGVWMPGRLPCE